MDHGFPCVTIHIAVCFRIPRRAPELEMGLRNRVPLRTRGCPHHHVLYGRDVRCAYTLVLLNRKIDKSFYSMFDRTLKPIPERPTMGLRYRVETLLGITGFKLAKHRISWTDAIMSQFQVVWRPHVLPVLIFEVSIFL